MAPLSGFRIIEVGDESGVFGGRLLADLGAEVVRVEPPDGGPLRGLGPFVDDIAGVERGLKHQAFNAGKRSVVLDLETEVGRTSFLELVASAEGLIDSGRAGFLANIDLDDRRILSANPGLTRVTISPFGMGGPWAGRVGSDLIASAAGGLSFVSGEPERPPIHAAGDVCYKLASLAGCTAMLAGLHGGPGMHFDISVQECTAFATLQTASPSYYRWHGLAVSRNTAYEFPVIRCRDDRWAVIRSRPDQWPKLRDWALQHHLPVRAAAEDWREATRAKIGSFRLGEAADIVEALGQFYDRDEFLVVGRERGLMGLPLMSFDDMRDSEQLAAIGEFVRVEHPTLGVLQMPKSPFAGMASVEPLRSAPLLGADPVDLLSAPSARPPVRVAARAAGELPLAGLRVLELSWVLAGPLGCRILANLGAEVIKVESESRMDSIRGSVPPSSGPTFTAGGWFNDANTGKLSATINTKPAEGRELLRRLAMKCDIVIDNLRPGVVERMGVNYAELRELHPGIIVAHMAGAGRSGPWANFATFGNMITGASGLNVITGWKGAPPTGLGVAFADFVSPSMVASAVIAAVIERSRTGLGQEIDMSQLPGMISLMSAEWMRYARRGEQEPRRQNRDPNYCPHGIFPAAGVDQWIALAVGPDMFASFAAAIGEPALAADPRFESHAARKQNEAALEAMVSTWTGARDRWAAAEDLQAAGIPAAAVESIADQLELNPQMMGRFEVVQQPTEPGLAITVHGEPIRIDGRDDPVRRSPALGEHNEYVFREILGLDEDEFVGLLGTGTIG
ncbi:MAG: CoA transferase [Tepidiformaceae bacterium]